MTPVMVNGRPLGVERNGVFSGANTAAIPGGRLWTEAAHAWNDMRAAAIEDGMDPAAFVPNGPASSARSVEAQRWFWNHRPPAAAPPGTSNHGWGLAVDVATRIAAAWILKHGQRFGWSWDEGRRVGEWWHFRYVGGYRPRRAALAHLTQDERRWVTEYDRLRAAGKDPDRRRVLRRVMRERRKAIWSTARESGWDSNSRLRRYRSLLARTR
jgi:D-alanyl-D-alanine carboxypeptidase-like protein